MYCKKCGKFIGNESDYCDECMVKESEVFSEFSENKNEIPTPQPTPTYYQNNNNYHYVPEVKLGKSIAAIILSEIGFLFIYLAVGILGELALLSYSGDYSAIVLMGGVGSVLCLLGLIFGIQAIASFKATSMFKIGKRIPTLILGIVSVVSSAIALFLVFIMVIALGLI